MMRILIAVGLLMAGAMCEAGELVRATLEPSTNHAGQLVMRITNVSSNTIRFLDIREGTGECGEFYEVTVEKGGKTYESKGMCLYAPAGDPTMVELKPGKTYDRDIKPNAYDVGEITPPCSITVTYRLSDKMKKLCREMAYNVDVGFAFRTDTLEIRASNRVSEPSVAPAPQF
jgi:hypothetical protein